MFTTICFTPVHNNIVSLFLYTLPAHHFSDIFTATSYNEAMEKVKNQSTKFEITVK